MITDRSEQILPPPGHDHGPGPDLATIMEWVRAAGGGTRTEPGSPGRAPPAPPAPPDPPAPHAPGCLATWFTGRQTVTRIVALHLFTVPGGLRLVPVVANGQSAFAVYQREPGGAYQAHAVLVPNLTTAGVARMVAFQNPALFAPFGLPPHYPAAEPGPSGTRWSHRGPRSA